MKIIDIGLMEEFRHAPKCEWCGRATPNGADPHHLWGRGFGGGTRLDIRINLISLCRGWTRKGWVSCHDLVHRGEITREDLLAKVAARENLRQDDIIREIYRLQRTPNDPGSRRPRRKK